MLKCPQQLHNIYFFKSEDSKLYVADLDECKVLEIDKLTWDVLEMCSFNTTDQIIEHLKGNYSEDEIVECLQTLQDVEESGFLFGTSSIKASQTDGDRMKIFAPKTAIYTSDIKGEVLGAVIAHRYLLGALSKYADVYVTQENDLIEGTYVTSFNPRDRASILKTISANYDGVLLYFISEMEFLPLLRYLQVPVVMPVYADRGDSGGVINAMLQWYAFMRSFDAFMVLTDSSLEFYSKLVMDTSLFHVIPCGVNLEHFKPMDKQAAKREVAKILGKPEILLNNKKIVGFLSRFQPEKGARIYVKVAEMNPQYLFLAVGSIYSHHDLPDNLICTGRRHRDELPLFYNAFDVFCFPSMVGSETFGLVVLEAMACGVPVVVPNFDGPPHVVGDAGVIVPAETFSDDLGSFAGYVSPEAMSEGINFVLGNDDERMRLGAKARERAMKYTWDNSARMLIDLFRKLNLKKLFAQRKRDFSIAFAPVYENIQTDLKYKSTLINLTTNKETPLVFDAYSQSVEEGLALTLLKRHSQREVEAVLRHICEDKHKVEDTLKRTRAFMDATS